MHISYTRYRPNRRINVKNVDINLFTSVSKRYISLRQFWRKTQSLNTFLFTSLVHNYVKIEWKNVYIPRKLSILHFINYVADCIQSQAICSCSAVSGGEFYTKFDPNRPNVWMCSCRVKWQVGAINQELYATEKVVLNHWMSNDWEKKSTAD